jgi:uncharacterized membrane protein YesL
MAKASTPRYSSTTRALGILNSLGEVLVLQLCFAVASLGVVTILPAAIALQRGLEEVLVGSESASVRRFAQRLRQEFRAYRLLSLALPAGALVLIVSISFWSATSGPVRLLALAFVLPSAGLALGLYVSGLATFISLPEPMSGKQRIGVAWRRVRGQPLSVAASMVVMVTWFLLLLRLPTLGLIGSGIVPALLAVWLERGRLTRPRDEHTTET